MNAEIISVSKQLYGDRIDKNVKVLTELLNMCSVSVDNSTVIGTDARELKKALRQAVARSELIIVCGGVGSDEDDNTVKAVCSAVGLGCNENDAAVAKLKSTYGDALTERQLNAALVPNGAVVFDNTVSVAPGCAISAAAQSIVLLPDEPAALDAMVGGPLRQFVISKTGFSIIDDADEPEFEAAVLPFEAKTPVFEDDPTSEDLGLDKIFDEPVAPVLETEAPAAMPEPPVFDPETEADEIIPADEVDWNVDAMFAADTYQLADEANKGDDNTEDTECKETPWPVRVAQYILPWKGDRLLDVVRKLVFMIATVGLVVSGVYISEYFIDNRNEKEAEDRFADLIEQNDEVVGWLTVANTKIDNAVYQTDNNDYYVDHNALKESSVYGALFADYRNEISESGNSTNITIYGHHMKDGTMLANLHKYKSLDFYKETPTVTFDTIYGTGGVYKVFACMITNADSADDNGYFFNYTVSNFDSNSDFLSWIEQIRRRSLYITPVDVVPGDEILTLSTCTYEIKGVELRCVVVARKVREGEDTKVNTTETSYNSKVIYPAVWYEKKGGEKPVYDDGLTTWLAQPNYETFVSEVEIEDNTASDTSSSSSSQGSSSASSAESSSATSSSATSSSATSSTASSGAASSTATSSSSTATSTATSSTAASTSSTATDSAASSATSSAAAADTASAASNAAASTSSTANATSQAASSSAPAQETSSGSASTAG